MNSQPASFAACAMRGWLLHTMPFTANVGVIPNFCMQSNRRQNPTRLPYSCHAQFGRSGRSGCPIGGGSTVRGITRSIDQCSTLTIVHTTIRAPSGSLSGGRSTVAEEGTRSERRRGIASGPEVEALHQLVVAKRVGVLALEHDLAVHDDVAAVGDTDRLLEVLLRHQHGEVEFVFQLLDHGHRVLDEERR